MRKIEARATDAVSDGIVQESDRLSEVAYEKTIRRCSHV